MFEVTRGNNDEVAKVQVGVHPLRLRKLAGSLPEKLGSQMMPGEGIGVGP